MTTAYEVAFTKTDPFALLVERFIGTIDKDEATEVALRNYWRWNEAATAIVLNSDAFLNSPEYAAYLDGVPACSNVFCRRKLTDKSCRPADYDYPHVAVAGMWRKAGIR